jgi:hypothetical protein
MRLRPKTWNFTRLKCFRVGADNLTKCHRIHGVRKEALFV